MHHFLLRKQKDNQIKNHFKLYIDISNSFLSNPIPKLWNNIKLFLILGFVNANFFFL